MTKSQFQKLNLGERRAMRYQYMGREQFQSGYRFTRWRIHLQGIGLVSYKSVDLV